MMMEAWKLWACVLVMYFCTTATSAYPSRGFFRQNCRNDKDCQRKLGFGFCLGGYCERSFMMIGKTCSVASEKKCPDGYECINYYCREKGGGLKLFTSGFHF